MKDVLFCIVFVVCLQLSFSLPSTHKDYSFERLGREALKLGKVGKLKQSVEAFENLLEKSRENAETGSHAKLLNNAGVAQMKYGLQLLSESEKRFADGLKVDPNYDKARTNLKRVQRILGEKSTVPSSTDKEKLRRKQSSTSFTMDENENIRDNFVPSEKLQKVFETWLFDDKVKQKVKVAMGARKPIQIRNALRKDFADKLHKELYQSDSYYVREGYRPLYQFHFSAFYDSDIELFKKHPNLSTLHNMLGSDYVYDWISDVSSSSVDRLVTSASLYRPGDYVMPHSDVDHDKNNGVRRRVAFILHMASQWDPSFGGELIMLNPLTPIAPIYNSITLFPVNSNSFHLVAPVAHNVPYPKFKRLAVSGWFQSKNLDEALFMESLGNDRFVKYPQFSIDGTNGDFVPNTQELSDEDLISSLKRGPIYEDKIVEKKIEAEDEQWEKCVGTFVNNDCHKGKLIDTRDLDFDMFEGQRTFGKFLYGSDDGGDA